MPRAEHIIGGLLVALLGCSSKARAQESASLDDEPECEQELVEEDGVFVVTTDCTIDGEIDRPEVQIIIQPTPIEFGPLPPYSPLHELAADDE